MGVKQEETQLEYGEFVEIENQELQQPEESSTSLEKQMQDEELEKLIDTAQNAEPEPVDHIQETSMMIQPMSLSSSIVNELEAIYRIGGNISSELAQLYGALPSSNSDLKDMVEDLTNFAMRQDRWIVLRIDALADVVAEYNTRITSISNRVTSNYNSLSSRISSNDTDIGDLSKSISSNDTDISNLSGRISGNDTDINNLSSNFSAIKAVVSENKSNIIGMSGSITKNANNIATMSSQIASSNVSVVGAINDLSGLITTKFSQFFNNTGVFTVAMQGKFDQVISAINKGTVANTAAIALTKYDDSNLSSFISTKFSQFFNDTGIFTVAMQSKFDQVVTAVKNSTYDDTSLKEHITYKMSQFFNDVGVFTVAMQNKFNEVITAINNMSVANAAAIALTKYNDTSLKELITHKMSQFFNTEGVFTVLMQDKFDELISAINRNFLANTAAIALTKYDDSEFMSFLSSKFSQFFNDSGIFTVAMQAKFDQVIKSVRETAYDDTSLKEFITYKFSQFFNDVGIFTVSMQAKFDQVISAINNSGKGIKDYTLLITGLNANQLLNTIAINDFARQNELDMALLAAVVSENAYDDTTLKEHITFKLSQFFNDVGIFTVAMQAKFDQVISAIKNNAVDIEAFKLYLREEFALLNDWLSLVVEWLDMLYEKPVAIFEDEVFDYGRLQEILDSISFGNVVNEAGTNLWDVLQQLIESLSGVVESIMNIVPDLIDQFISLFIPEDKEFFSKKLNAVSEKFNTKFEAVLDLSTSVKNLYSQPKSLGQITYTIFDVEMKLIPEFMFQYLGTFRLMMGALVYMSTFISIYKRFVGEGDVIS